VSGDVGADTGSVAEEAVKLLEALQGWARESGADYADAAAAAAAGASSTAHRVSEHLATGSAECRYCPLCQVIAAVRGTPPEVREHLASAATSLLHAVSGLLATVVPEQGVRGGAPVERIDLDDEEWEDD
jgi:hypothetical protein